MANLRNPLLTATNTLTNGGGAVNVEEVSSIEKAGDTGILFVFNYDKQEQTALWEFVDLATRDTEFALMIVASDVWDVATDGMFVSSSAQTVVFKTGKDTVNEESVNLNKVTRISTSSQVNFLGDGGETIYTITFTLKAIDSLKETTWHYTSDVDRDAVFGELTIVAADAVYLT